MHGRTCVFNINYHNVWSTKYRRKVLTSEIETRLKEILVNVAQEKGFKIAEIKVGAKDHVHVFASAKPTRYLKSYGMESYGTIHTM